MHSLPEYVETLKKGTQHFISLVPNSRLGNLSPTYLENIYVFDKNLRCLYSTIQEVTTVSGIDLFDADMTAANLDYLNDDIHSVLATGEIASGQLINACNPGNKYYDYLLIPLVINNNTEGVQCVIRDRTKRETDEYIENELNRLDRFHLIGKMAAGVADEIRNPITVIRGYLQHYQGNPAKCSQETFQLLLTELDRVNGIVSEFLTLASNKVSLKAPADLNSLLDEVHPLIYEAAISRGVEVDLQFADNLPVINLDSKEIKQLILNLSRNALDAITAGGKLTIRTEDHPNAVGFSVADTGNGISEEVLLRMFDPFFTTKESATGLGLAVCMSIVARHNGTIEVRSEDDKGTEFIITFPLTNSV